MATPCYCCSHNKQKQIVETTTGEMELDAALHELGMLSTITNSRIDYLDEKVKKKRSSNSLSSAPLCVVQMNAKFVTKFSLSKSYSASIDSESEEENDSTSLRRATNNVRMCNRKMRHTRSRHYMYKPYDFPWRSKLEDSVKNIVEAVAAENASPPVMSRQDSGNKSNPSSPVKSQKSSTNLGCSIFRSRSLDDLEISKLELKEDCSNEAGRAEIDTVSQRISRLHVS